MVADSVVSCRVSCASDIRAPTFAPTSQTESKGTMRPKSERLFHRRAGFSEQKLNFLLGNHEALCHLELASDMSMFMLV